MGENGNGTVTAPDPEEDVTTIDVVGVAQARQKLAQLQTQAEETDQKLREIDVDAEVATRRAKEAKAGLATIGRR